MTKNKSNNKSGVLLSMLTSLTFLFIAVPLSAAAFNVVAPYHHLNDLADIGKGGFVYPLINSKDPVSEIEAYKGSILKLAADKDLAEMVPIFQDQYPNKDQLEHEKKRKEAMDLFTGSNEVVEQFAETLDRVFDDQDEHIYNLYFDEVNNKVVFVLPIFEEGTKVKKVVDLSDGIVQAMKNKEGSNDGKENGKTSEETLAQSLVSDFVEGEPPFYNFFVGEILHILQQTAESGSSIFSDKDSYSGEELRKMKEISLENIMFAGRGGDKFAINGVEFSNRISTKGELRNYLLRKALLELKKKVAKENEDKKEGEKRKVSLYDALSKLARSTDVSAIQLFGSFLMRTTEERLGKYTEARLRIIHAINKLLLACTDYVEKQLLLYDDRKAVQEAVEIMVRIGKDFFALALDENKSEDDLLAELKKERDKILKEKRDKILKLENATQEFLKSIGIDQETIESFKKYGILLENSENSIDLTDKDKELIKGIIVGIDNYDRLKKILEEYGFSKTDSTTIEKLKNSLYFNNIGDKNLRQVLKDTKDRVHCDSPPIIYSILYAIGYKSTTKCVIDLLNKAYKADDKVALKKHLRQLGLTEEEAKVVMERIALVDSLHLEMLGDA